MLGISDVQATKSRFRCELMSVRAGPTRDSGLGLPYLKLSTRHSVLPPAHMRVLPTPVAAAAPPYITISLDWRLTL